MRKLYGKEDKLVKVRLNRKPEKKKCLQIKLYNTECTGSGNNSICNCHK